MMTTHFTLHPDIAEVPSSSRFPAGQGIEGLCEASICLAASVQ